MTEIGRDRARQAVAAEMADRQIGPYELGRLAGVDPDTIATFLKTDEGSRWPKVRTQGRIERALMWEPGTIRAVENGAEPPPLHSRLSAEALADKVPNQTDEERDELIDAIRASSVSKVRALRAVLRAMDGNGSAL